MLLGKSCKSKNVEGSGLNWLKTSKGFADTVNNPVNRRHRANWTTKKALTISVLAVDSLLNGSIG
jgi:hypothetical protein